MNIGDVLEFPSFASAQIVAGSTGLSREVVWSHVVDLPEPAAWIRPGHLLLTTGFSWPKHGEEQRLQMRQLAQAGAAGIVLAVPKFVKHFAAEAREEADEAGVPLIEIPFDVPFAQIMEELHRAIMAEPYRIIERSEQIHRELTRAATRDASLDDLAHSLQALIGRSITFEDPAGKLLAHASLEGETDAIRTQTVAEAQTPHALVGYLEKTGLASAIRRHDGPLRIAAMPEMGLSARVVCPIRLGTELAGLVWIVEGELPLSELDHRAAEHAALVAAMQIARQRELAAVESRLGYASLLSLLQSEPGQTQASEERVRILGFDPNARYRVGIVVIAEDLPLSREGVLRRDRIASSIKDELRKQRVEQLVTAYLNYVPFLLPQAANIDTLFNSLADSTLSIALGRAHVGADGARASYREALSLISYRHREAISLYEDLLVPRVIMGEVKARETFLEELFAPLRARKNGKSLALAVLALARSGFQFRFTADQLDIHPNTLRYRLDRATEALGLDLSDPDSQFRLQLA
ncbi:MAG: PucR family transcriptional regulator ligand-binding domain-containing protein, partial [Candidatus Eremiobacteraeota bacterium]|nr:PucR family transcriptional regulator ligand-binding domain-containing protein [Candidatus Eremiobacteraeota bacterium]